MNQMRLKDPAFIEAVNLAYHEEEAAEYDGRHPEIFRDEVARWESVRQALSELRRRLCRPIRLLDIGSGTGFVPVQLSSVLKKEDVCMLADLSPAMLDQAKRALAAAHFPAGIEIRSGAADRLRMQDGSLDVVTMNSIVHHLPEPKKVFATVDRLLKPGGLVVISHEPNLRHFQNPIIGWMDRGLRFLRWTRNRWRAGAAEADPFIERVNRRLLSAKVAEEPMSIEEIESIVDIHSPTAGRTVRPERGFDPRGLAAESFSGYGVKLLLTYQHFGKVNLGKIAALRPFQRWMERLWPDAGALFLMILEKPGK